jgi:uncharacterized alpha-E superfamily protein
MALLKSVTGFNTYRRLYGDISPSNVVEFLVLNPYFPRSVFYCLKEAEQSLYKISGSNGSGFSNRAEKAMGEVRSRLEFDDVNDLISSGLHEYLEKLLVKINHISNEIDNNYFQIKDNFVSQTMEQG